MWCILRFMLARFWNEAVVPAFCSLVLCVILSAIAAMVGIVLIAVFSVSDKVGLFLAGIFTALLLLTITRDTVRAIRRAYQDARRGCEPQPYTGPWAKPCYPCEGFYPHKLTVKRKSRGNDA